MKRLVQAGVNRIFQIGPCFRRGEYGSKHRPEFTLLEWYMANADYRDILEHTQNLIRDVFGRIHGVRDFTYREFTINVHNPWKEVSVKHAFEQHANVGVDFALENDVFDQQLVENIEPKLGIREPTILIDYPVELGGLARQKPSDRRVAERWELYIAGIELANAYSELTDVVEQRKRFEACAKFRRSQNRPVYPVDNEFLRALGNGMPACAGCALGIDRLLMILANSSKLDDVLFF